MHPQECKTVQRWVVEKVPREEQEEECSFEPTPFCEDFKVDLKLSKVHIVCYRRCRSLRKCARLFK